MQSQKSNTIAEWLFFRYLQNSKKGSLSIRFPDGNTVLLGDLSSEPVRMEILDTNFFRKCFWFGEIGFGESYMQGDWKSDDLNGVISWFLENSAENGAMSSSSNILWFVNMLGGINKIRHRFRRNTKSNSRKNISEHYDISNEFYSLMLDKTMTYSSAIFSSSEDLESAQIRKYETICRKLNLNKNHRVLEIGCGWGGFSRYAAEKYGCKIDAVTISEEQFLYARENISANCLNDLVKIKLCDYRDLRGKYDRIVSIEMVEALGHEYVDLFFRQCNGLLEKDGIMLIQCITMPDPYFDRYIRQTDWIQKHIFPGGCLLSQKQILESLNRTGNLIVWDLESFGPDYGRTISIWKKNFKLNIEKVKALGLDDEFLRKWEYYLSISEVGFNSRYTNVVQLLLTSPMNKNIKSRSGFLSDDFPGRQELIMQND
ncbi:MAG: cyclopropane-fatty-acyl-phospholipid synthase family protein [Leptospira sp.]|nr:cyclopropane-fatty-acyl-phospholipid synthase family protein [Leptospira sp.]